MTDIRCESFKTEIRRLYGEDLIKYTNRFEKLRLKKGKLLCNLAFLCRCRDGRIIPKFAKIKHHVMNNRVKNILDHASIAIVRERIRDVRKRLSVTSQELLDIHLKLSNAMQREDCNRIDRITTQKEEWISGKVKKKQIQKFNKLSGMKSDINVKNKKRATVINLTNKPMEPVLMSVLEKGLNFALTPDRLPIKKFITGTEAAIKHLPEESAEEIRNEVSLILKTFKRPKPNLKKDERMALNELRNSAEILVLPADKGNAAVIMELETYREKMIELLSDPDYVVLKKDPTSSIMRKTNEMIKKSSITEEIKRKISPKPGIPPRIYGLPKIHKQGIPLRPIVNSIGSPNYHLAKYLARILKPFVGGTAHHVKNSYDFVKTVQQISINAEDILVSFDVKSLFTKVPLEDTLEELGKIFPHETKEMFKYVLTSTYFLYDGRYYEQKDGVAMGSPLSPVIANFYMEKFEKIALDSARKTPTHWYRYVDDTFVIWPHGMEELEKFLDHLNTIHERIQFTMEVEKNGELPFLDILIYKHPNGKLGHKVYRKPTHTDLYLNANSYHHPAQKQAVISTLLHRALEISDGRNRKEEISHVYQTLKNNGYKNNNIKKTLQKELGKRKKKADREDNEDKHYAVLPFVNGIHNKLSKIFKTYNIQCRFIPNKKIKNILRTPKDRLGLRMPGVYRISCECGACYIGQTGRTVQCRQKEHIRALKYGYVEKSTVAEHAIEQKHEILFEDTKVLHTEDRIHDRIVLESIEIELNENKMNKDNCFVLSNRWKVLLRQ